MGDSVEWLGTSHVVKQCKLHRGQTSWTSFNPQIQVSEPQDMLPNPIVCFNADDEGGLLMLLVVI